MRLDFNGYTYPSVRVEANPDFSETEVKSDEYDTRIGFSFDLNNSKFNVNLIVSTASDQKNIAYDLSVHVMGSFGIDKLVGDDILEASRDVIVGKSAFLLKNAVVLLYSSLRDYIHTLTGKAPFGNETLPTAFFDAEEIYKGASGVAGEEGEDVADLLIKHGLARLSE